MNNKLLLIALLTATVTETSANQEQPPAHQDTTRGTTLVLGFTEQQWHDMMKNSYGPCHNPVNVPKCCQWKEDSTAVKRTEKENDRLETLRHCCYSVDCEGRSKKLHK